MSFPRICSLCNTLGTNVFAVFPYLKWLNTMYPTHYRANCTWCGGIPTLIDITRECTKHLNRSNTTNRMEQSEAQLAHSDVARQKSLISQVRQAAEASGSLDRGAPTTAPQNLFHPNKVYIYVVSFTPMKPGRLHWLLDSLNGIEQALVVELGHVEGHKERGLSYLLDLCEDVLFPLRQVVPE